jgi:hypothetical protein
VAGGSPSGGVILEQRDAGVPAPTMNSIVSAFRYKDYRRDGAAGSAS